MKYNYVVLGVSSDYYRVSYADLNKRNDSVYQSELIDTKVNIKNFLYRVHTSPTINNKIHLPFQSIWNSTIYKNKFKDDKPLCFLFFTGRKREIDNGFPEYLRKKYPGVKLALFYQDLVKRSLLPDVESLKYKFDIILSFDQLDAKNYGIYYYPLVYSQIDIPKNKNIKKSDIYFVGKAKDRLNRIISSYEIFRNAGLVCDFHIIGVRPQDQKYADEIVYQEQMPYIENLQRIQASKCMLEIMQQGGHGYTLRYCEAIMYDKKIITDNPEIDVAPFYNPNLIQVFKEPNEINTSFVNADPLKANYNYKKNLSPVHMLEFIDQQI